MDTTYTESWEKEDEGPLKYQSTIQKHLRVKYIGTPNWTAQPVSYTYEFTPFGGGKGSGTFTPLSEGYFEAQSGGNGALPPKTAHVRVTVNWNGLVEVLELK